MSTNMGHRAFLVRHIPEIFITQARRVYKDSEHQQFRTEEKPEQNVSLNCDKKRYYRLKHYNDLTDNYIYIA